MRNFWSIHAWSLRKSFCMDRCGSSRANEKEASQMRQRFLAPRFLLSIGVVAIAIAAGLMMPPRAPGQAGSAAKATPAAKRTATSTAATGKAGPTEKNWTAPRTADGQPALRGVWDYRT